MFISNWLSTMLTELNFNKGKYILKGRPINLTTDIVALAIDLLDGTDI